MGCGLNVPAVNLYVLTDLDKGALRQLPVMVVGADGGEGSAIGNDEVMLIAQRPFDGDGL